MALHAILNWIKGREPELHCDCYGCEMPMNMNHVAYNAKYQKVYHIEDCATIAFGEMAFNPDSPEILTIDYITREEAVSLYLQGKLTQRWDN